MKWFDVLANPNRAMRRERPYLLVLQHIRLSQTATIVVAPLSRPEFVTPYPRLMPRLLVLGSPMILITHELSALERHRLPREPIDNLESERIAIQNALDVVFSAAD